MNGYDDAYPKVKWMVVLAHGLAIVVLWFCEAMSVGLRLS